LAWARQMTGPLARETGQLWTLFHRRELRSGMTPISHEIPRRTVFLDGNRSLFASSFCCGGAVVRAAGTRKDVVAKSIRVLT